MRLNSLSVKIIGLFGGIVILITLILTVLIYYNFKEIFKTQLTEKGKQLSDFFNKHSSITYGFMQEDKFLLSEVISLFLRDKDVIFAAVVKKNGEIMAYKSKDERIDDDIIWFIRNYIIKRTTYGDEDKVYGGLVEKKTVTGDEVIIFSSPVKLERTGIPLLGDAEGEEKSEKILKGFTVLGFTMRNFETEFNRRIWSIVFLISGIGVLAFSISVVLLRGNLKPLSRMREISEKISKEGDLRERPNIHSMDEVGEIASSFARMIDILKTEIEEIKMTSMRLSRISKELLRTMDKITQSSHMQDEEIGKITTSIQDVHDRALEILSMVDEVSRIMNKVAEDATQSESEIREIRRNLEDQGARIDEITSKIFLVKKKYDDVKAKLKISEISGEIMSDINSLKNSIKYLEEEVMSIDTTINNISEAADNLSEEVQNVERELGDIYTRKEDVVQKLSRIKDYVKDIMGKVFELLDSIDDTNMLAINAHIIASHAGKEGEEFGIVAQEIQQLSVETEKKVKSIKETLTKLDEEISLSTEIMTDDMEEIIQNINNSKKQLSESINKMKGNSDETKDKFKSIKPSIKKMSEISGHLDNDFKHLSEDVKRIENLVEGSEEIVSTSAEEMKNIKIQLNKIIEAIANLTEVAKRFAQRSGDATSTLTNIKNEANKQYQKVNEVGNSITNLENTIAEVRKIVLMSRANVEAISKLARKLDEMVKRFKT